MSGQSQKLPNLLSFTKLSRGIAIVLVTGFVVQFFVPSSREYIALVPGRFLPCVWTVFTGGLLETNIFGLIFSVVGVLLLAKIIEPIWGSREFLLFVTVVNVFAGLATLTLVYVIYTVDLSGQMLYHQVSGFQGVIAGCLVAIKQIMPDNDVTLLAVLKFRAKHLPLIFVVLSGAGSALLGNLLDWFPSVLFGTLAAWGYLRFFQQRPELSIQGDPSDEFSFSSFFPDFLQPVINKIFYPCARFLASRSPQPEGSNGFKVGSGPLPGSDTADSSRRRERGARALEERLGQKAPKVNPSNVADGDIEAGPSSAVATEPVHK